MLALSRGAEVAALVAAQDDLLPLLVRWTPLPNGVLGLPTVCCCIE
jgi:hypothetical protein